MRRSGRRAARGVLIVEAIISTVVIAVGLVWISRGLSNQLQALRMIEEHDTLLSLARTTLVELEGERSVDQPPSRLQEGTFQAPYEAYGWTITLTPQDVTDGVPRSEIMVSVQRHDRLSSRVRLSAVWPTDWVPAEWL